METTAKRAALKTIWRKLQKLLSMLTSDNAGEAFNALQKIKRLLQSVKMDLHDLIALVFAKDRDDPLASLLQMLLGAKDPDILVGIAQKKAKFFCALDGDVYATVGTETWPLEAAGAFGDWLLAEFLDEIKKVTSGTAVKSAVRVLQAAARRRTTERHEVFVRTANFGDRLYIDLANASGEVVEIDAAGWRIITDPPVKFLRPADLRPLPTPQRGATINRLRPYVNLSDAGFILFVQLLVDALHPRDERPVGSLFGGEGRAKSTAAKLMQRLLDPRATDPGNPPPTVRELNGRAKLGRVLVFDNLSSLSRSMSDAICRLASGVGSSNRKLFTDHTQVTVRGSRSIFFTAVKNPVIEPDLAERQVILTGALIKNEQRKTLSKFWREFEQDYPFVLGALYNVAAHGLRELSNIRLPHLPRLAEFVECGVACETGHGLGSFLDAFKMAAAEATDAIIENDPVALAILAFMGARGGHTWTGTATALMAELKIHDHTEQRVSAWKNWPHDVRDFGAKLWRAETVLHKSGIELVRGDRSKDPKRERSLTLRMVTPVAESTPSPDDKPSTKVIALRKI